uniref:uncharacterized protein LOC120328730 n=1 Tax=Styela clava TaxID=7725 RepID=UPI00193A8FD1|nr:uncharacterized protein LOC120328730 [Styela clava]
MAENTSWLLGGSSHNKQQIRTDWTRWLVAILLVTSGFLLSICRRIFAVANNVTIGDLHISNQTFYLLTLAGDIGMLIGSPIVGYIAMVKQTRVKIWFIVIFAILWISFVIFALALFLQYTMALCIAAQIAIGIGSSIYFMLIPLSATVWFGEREQATAFSLGWSAMLFAGLFCSFLPGTIVSKLYAINGDDTLSRTMARMFVALGFLSSGLLMVACVNFPNFPATPPSYAEMQRLALTKQMGNETLSYALRRFLKEIRFLITDRTSFILALWFNLNIAIYVAEYTRFPPPTSPDLLAFSSGGFFGCIFMGIALDRLKSYNPLANIMGVSTIISSISVTLSCASK